MSNVRDEKCSVAPVIKRWLEAIPTNSSAILDRSASKFCIIRVAHGKLNQTKQYAWFAHSAAQTLVSIGFVQARLVVNPLRAPVESAF
jgi:hypothetical protein